MDRVKNSSHENQYAKSVDVSCMGGWESESTVAEGTVSFAFMVAAVTKSASLIPTGQALQELTSVRTTVLAVSRTFAKVGCGWALRPRLTRPLN